MTELTQESLLESEETEVNLIGNDVEYNDNNMFIRQIINKTSNYDEINDAEQNMKRKWKWKWKWKRKWRKYKYGRKKKMKKKIATMVMNATNEYHTSKEDAIGDKEIKGTLKMIYRRKLTKKKRVPNQWPDHPT